MHEGIESTSSKGPNDTVSPRKQGTNRRDLCLADATTTADEGSAASCVPVSSHRAELRRRRQRAAAWRPPIISYCRCRVIDLPGVRFRDEQLRRTDGAFRLLEQPVHKSRLGAVDAERDARLAIGERLAALGEGVAVVDEFRIAAREHDHRLQAGRGRLQAPQHAGDRPGLRQVRHRLESEDVGACVDGRRRAGPVEGLELGLRDAVARDSQRLVLASVDAIRGLAALGEGGPEAAHRRREHAVERSPDLHLVLLDGAPRDSDVAANETVLVCGGFLWGTRHARLGRQGQLAALGNSVRVCCD
mmetsp:Transcript_54262/g.164875  ORF Transcript_54262/g.164875 Transcript_54262/m.164875 type:complete len:303 (+) Transcript_54262:120-1028(+)